MARDFFKPLFIPRGLLEKHYDRVEQKARRMIPQELTREIKRRQRLTGPISLAITSLWFIDGLILMTAPVRQPEVTVESVLLIPLLAMVAVNVLYLTGPSRWAVREEEEKILKTVANEGRVQVLPSGTAANVADRHT